MNLAFFLGSKAQEDTKMGVMNSGLNGLVILAAMQPLLVIGGLAMVGLLRRPVRGASDDASMEESLELTGVRITPFTME